MLSGLINGNGPVSHGEYTAVTGDGVAGTVAISTGLSSIEACIAQVRRAGALVTADANVSYSGGTLTVANGGTTFVLAAGDVVAWIAIGT
jgi:hypothetical protein